MDEVEAGFARAIREPFRRRASGLLGDRRRPIRASRGEKRKDQKAPHVILQFACDLYQTMKSRMFSLASRACA